MIPVKLIVKGIYSYRERQEIDFIPLAEAGLFGIFGPVGSGKSALLDAISLALFGDSERLNTPEKNYNVMNLKSNELFVSFEFTAGKTNEHCKIEINSKRNSKKFSHVYTLDRKGYIKQNDTWIPCEISHIQQLIGLSYKNFKRTMIIPQGRFQEFIQLSGSERTSMLMELFQLERFDLYKKTTLVENKVSEQKANLEGQLTAIGPVDEISISETETEIARIAASQIEKNQILNGLLERNLQFESILEISQKIAKHETDLKLLKIDSPHFDERENKLLQYEKCFYEYKEIITHKKTLDNQINGLRSGYQLLLNEENSITEQLETEERHFAEISEKFNKTTELRNQIDDYSNIREIKLNKTDIDEKNKKLLLGDQFLKGVNTEIESLEKEIASISEEIIKLKNSKPDIHQLNEIKHWFVILNNLQQSRYQHQNEIKNSEALIDEQSNLINSHIDDFGLKIDDKTKPELIQLHINQLVIELRNEVTEIENLLQSLNIKDELNKYSMLLIEGQPCPLCGSTRHPEILKIEDVAQELKNLKQRKKDCQTRIGLLEKLYTEISVVMGKNETSRQTQQNLKSQLETLNEKISAHRNLYTWANMESITETDVDIQLGLAKKIEKSLEMNEAALRIKSDLLDINRSKKEKAIEKLTKYQTELAGCKAKVLTLENSLKTLLFTDFEFVTDTEIEKMIQRKQDEIIQTEENYFRLQKKLKELTVQKSHLQGQIKGMQEQLEDLLNQQRNNEQLISIRIQQSGNLSIQEIEEILAWNFDVSAERGKINRFREQLFSKAKAIEELNSELDGRQYDDNQHEAVRNQIVLFRDQIKIDTEELGILNNKLSELKKNLEKSKQLQISLLSINNKISNLQILKKLFKGNGFVNYVSTVFLEGLVENSNHRFMKLSRQQLRMEVDTENNLNVIDYMNEGRKRSIKTLSGGQTFQAAISLALSLSDNFRQINGQENNFFFLDEGFGSLDKQSLNIVFDTLNSLKLENRMVGLISHVEEMQEEIPVYLKISNDPEKGSQIRRSWE